MAAVLFCFGVAILCRFISMIIASLEAGGFLFHVSPFSLFGLFFGDFLTSS